MTALGVTTDLARVARLCKGATGRGVPARRDGMCRQAGVCHMLICPKRGLPYLCLLWPPGSMEKPGHCTILQWQLLRWDTGPSVNTELAPYAVYGHGRNTVSLSSGCLLSRCACLSRWGLHPEAGLCARCATASSIV